MGLEQLRARLERLLAGDANRKAGLREALVELKVAAGQSRDALAKAERELAGQEQQLADAERRGKLAETIADGETVRIAGEFATKHRERIDLLRRKVEVIRDELAFIEREYQSVGAEYRSPVSGVASAPAPEPDLDDSELRNLEYQAERERIERAVKAQLEALKQKMGRPSPSHGEDA